MSRPVTSAELADSITNRLFRVTLDLHHIRALTEHPVAAGRADRVIDELDEAINELRLLVTSITPIHTNEEPPEEEWEHAT